MHVLAVRIMNTASDTILSEISSPEEIYFIFFKVTNEKNYSQICNWFILWERRFNKSYFIQKNRCFMMHGIMDTNYLGLLIHE